MFYLLEDNKIINSKDYWEYAIGIDKDGKTCYRVEIKKQSENVFDLIEVGDLIARYRYSIEGRTNEKEINSVDELFEDENGVGINQCCIVDYDDICSIYKLDEKGNYIKVWEKKDE